jgi:hypothetical protein
LVEPEVARIALHGGPQQPHRLGSRQAAFQQGVGEVGEDGRWQGLDTRGSCHPTQALVGARGHRGADLPRQRVGVRIGLLQRLQQPLPLALLLGQSQPIIQSRH